MVAPYGKLSTRFKDKVVGRRPNLSFQEVEEAYSVTADFTHLRI